MPPLYFRSPLTFTTVCAYSADDKLVIFSPIFFPENRFSQIMQIVSLGDNLHEMSKSTFFSNKKYISYCRLLKMLPSILSVNGDFLELLCFELLFCIYSLCIMSLSNGLIPFYICICIYYIK